jgi:hypothetical protein
LDDKTLGYTIMGITLAIMAFYLVWLLDLLPISSVWAIRLPVILAVYMILFIVLWIGYTMATTPPPVPLDTPLDLDSEFDFNNNEDTEEEQ